MNAFCFELNACAISTYIFPLFSRFLAFDFLEGCGDECSSELLLSGYLNISVEFETSLTDPHVLIVYAISPNTMDIDSENQVRITQPIK